jgi:hypothetical protein
MAKSAGECHVCGTVSTGDDNTECAAHCDAVRRLSAQLAKVTAERDAGRERLLEDLADDNLVLLALSQALLALSQSLAEIADA